MRAVVREEPGLIEARHARHDATALHQAAVCGDLETARKLLDAGADPNDAGDDDHLGVIGWATFFPPPGQSPMPVVSLLLERGARHHVFNSASASSVSA